MNTLALLSALHVMVGAPLARPTALLGVTGYSSPTDGQAAPIVPFGQTPTGSWSSLSLDSSNDVYVNTAGGEATYSAAFQYNTSFYSLGNGTDFIVLTGSSTKTVRVTRLVVTPQAGGSSVQYSINLFKRTTADSGGTPVAVTPAQMDSADPAPTASLSYYTSAPTAGTGTQFGAREGYASSSYGYPGVNWSFGTNGEKPLILHGTAQSLCIQMTTGNAPGNFWVEIAWTER